MVNSLLQFHQLAESIWNQECPAEEFTNVLQQVAELKVVLWSANLMSVDEELRKQFFWDVFHMENVAQQVLRPSRIKELRPDSKTFYGYLYALLCNFSNDLLMIYNEFPYKAPIHIACGCGNDLHSVLVNPAELDDKNTTMVIPTKYEVEKDGLNLKNGMSEEVPEEDDEDALLPPFSESETPEGFGELDCNEWDFFGNVMRFLDSCDEEYLSGILCYLYGEHECSKCHEKEQVIASYRKWFEENHPNYSEPSRELIDWVTRYADELFDDDENFDMYFIAFLNRMAVWYEKSRNQLDMTKVYEHIMRYYDKFIVAEHHYVKQLQYVLRQLLDTDLEELKARAYNRLARSVAFDYSRHEECNRWDLAWEAFNKSVAIHHKINLKDSLSYWVAVNGLCLVIAESGEDEYLEHIEEVEQLILDYIECKKAQNAELTEIDSPYSRLAYMWGEGAGEYEKCYEYFNEYLNISKQIYGENSNYVADLLEELADYYEAGGDDVKACELREQALEINIREMGQMYLLPPIFKGIALFAAKVTKAIDESEKFDRVMSAAESYLELGENYYDLELYEQALDCCKKAQALYEWEFKGKKPVDEMAKVHLVKGNIYYDDDNEKLAAKEYEEAAEICKRVIAESGLDFEIENCKKMLEELEAKIDIG